MDSYIRSAPSVGSINPIDSQLSDDYCPASQESVTSWGNVCMDELRSSQMDNADDSDDPFGFEAIILANLVCVAIVSRFAPLRNRLSFPHRRSLRIGVEVGAEAGGVLCWFLGLGMGLGSGLGPGLRLRLELRLGLVFV